MAFLIIPICYIDGSTDDESEDITRLKRKGKASSREADIAINTQQICSYVGVEEINHTMVYMSDGNVYECTYERNRFESLLERIDSIVAIKEISEN